MLIALGLWLAITAMTLAPGASDPARTYFLPERIELRASSSDVETTPLHFVRFSSITTAALIRMTWVAVAAGLAMIVWRRMTCARWSIAGFATCAAALFAMMTIAGSGYRIGYSGLIEARHAGSMLATLDRLRPGLVDRIRAGERPALARLPTVAMDHTLRAVEPDRLLDDADTIDGLRFVLAQKVVAEGDLATARALLPFALPEDFVELPNRREFAARLAGIEDATGRAATPPDQRAEMRALAQERDRSAALVNAAGPIVWLLLAIGCLILVMSRTMVRRSERICRKGLAIEALAPTSVPA